MVPPQGIAVVQAEPVKQLFVAWSKDLQQPTPHIAGQRDRPLRQTARQLAVETSVERRRYGIAKFGRFLGNVDRLVPSTRNMAEVLAKDRAQLRKKRLRSIGQVLVQ
jgi:hypothetical protein